MGEDLPKVASAIPIRNRGVCREAYHGTTAENGKSIERIGFVEGKGVDLYYGDGVYFYEGDEAAARSWARGQYGDQGAIAVVEAEVLRGQCLTVHRREKRAADAVKAYLETDQKRSVRLGAAWNYVVELCERAGKKVDTIRYFDEIGGRNVPCLCVRALENIRRFRVSYSRGDYGSWTKN